jgi:hypothetical protein
MCVQNKYHVHFFDNFLYFKLSQTLFFLPGHPYHTLHMRQSDKNNVVRNYSSNDSHNSSDSTTSSATKLRKG